MQWIDTARSYLGEARIEGVADNPRILDLWDAAHLTHDGGDEDPWCAAFVGGAFAMNGLRGSGSAAARSYADWGEPCEFRRGAVVLIQPPGSPHITHVAFALEDRGDTVLVIGGNQGGDHACTVTAFKTRSIVGYRWPIGVETRDAVTVAELDQTGSKTAATAKGLQGSMGWLTTVTSAAAAIPPLTTALGLKAADSAVPVATAAKATSSLPTGDIQDATSLITAAKQIAFALNDLALFIGSHAILGLAVVCGVCCLTAYRIRQHRADTETKIRDSGV
jgi:uncharacterized protein (TIGR02594 family)